MRAPLSIVIPTLNAEASLPGCLAALGEGLQAGLIREVIISDGGSVDGTLVLADEAGADVVSGPPGRGGQLSRGARRAQGEWMLFLHADTWLEEGWTKPVLVHLGGDSNSAGVFRLRFRADEIAARIVGAWANFRTRAFGLPYGDQGLLVSRALYERVAGFSDIPLMEDVAMARALRGHLKVLAGVAASSAERYQVDGWLRRSLRNGWTLSRYLCGANPEALLRRYRGPR